MNKIALRHIAAVLVLVAALIVAGATCKNDPLDKSDSWAPEPDGGGYEGDPAAEPPEKPACPRALVTTGMGLGWKWLNHRISLWSIHPATAGCPGRVPQDTPLEVGFVGGNWSTGETMTDTPLYRYGYVAVDAPHHVGFAGLEVVVDIQSPGHTAWRSALVDLEANRLAGFESYTAFLVGLRLETDVEQTDPDYPESYDPALGYTSRGIGAGVGDVSVSEDLLAFPVWARFEHGLADRPTMNNAIPHARTRATLSLLVMGINGGKATATEHGYTMTYDTPRFLFQPNYEHAPVAMRQVAIDGAPGLPVAFVGLRSFNFALFGSVEKGDYLRELSVHADLVAYDGSTGRAQIDLDGYASNASTAFTELTMENDFSASVVLVQLPAGRVARGDSSGFFQTGQQQIPLP